jgi:hypothetical protein
LTLARIPAGARRGRAAHVARVLIIVVVIAALTVIGLAVTAAGRQWLHRVDATMLGERAMDTLARMRTAEDWSSAEPLRPGQDYAWLRSAGRPARIAHALGESGTPSANTLAAAHLAYEAGFRILEVDLVLENNELRCQHDAGPQGDLVKDGCTFETLMAELPKDTWVVLDIKADFEAVGQRVVDQVKDTADARRVVFQLYRPGDFAVFNRWQAQAPLPGPILTAYLAHRRIDHVAAQAGRTGIQAFTLPLDRLPALTVLLAGVTVLVHPVHNCSSLAEAWRRAYGVYMLSALQCPIPSSTGSQ